MMGVPPVIMVCILERRLEVPDYRSHYLANHMSYNFHIAVGPHASQEGTLVGINGGV